MVYGYHGVLLKVNTLQVVVGLTDYQKIICRTSMTRCLRDPTDSKECRAITISTSSDKTCELRADKVGDEAFVSSSTPKWQSFSRPAWYLGKLLYIILVQYNSAFNSLT